MSECQHGIPLYQHCQKCSPAPDAVAERDAQTTSPKMDDRLTLEQVERAVYTCRKNADEWRQVETPMGADYRSEEAAQWDEMAELWERALSIFTRPEPKASLALLQDSSGGESRSEVLDGDGDWQCRDYANGWITFPDRKAAEKYRKDTDALMRYREYFHADTAPRCPKCGYTREDCDIHMDHHLCGEPTPPATPESSVDYATASAAPVQQSWEGYLHGEPEMNEKLASELREILGTYNDDDKPIVELVKVLVSRADDKLAAEVLQTHPSADWQRGMEDAARIAEEWGELSVAIAIRAKIKGRRP